MAGVGKRGRATKSSYRVKKEAGLCGFPYDRDSPRFQAGAWRHWPEDRLGRLAQGMERVDRAILKAGREARGL